MSSNKPAELGTSNGNDYLIVGHISFDTGTGGADEYTLYNYTGLGLLLRRKR